MSSNNTIFLDLDGTIADFPKQALKVWNRMDLYPPQGELKTVLGIKTKEFWQRISENEPAFWTEMEPYEWATELVSKLKSLGKVVIATAPPRSPLSVFGKVTWIQHYFGPKFRDFVITPRKFYLSYYPLSVLIDDQEKNIDCWTKRGILFPQPWNRENRQPNPHTIVEEICQKVSAALDIH